MVSISAKGISILTVIFTIVHISTFTNGSIESLSPGNKVQDEGEFRPSINDDDWTDEPSSTTRPVTAAPEPIYFNPWDSMTPSRIFFTISLIFVLPMVFMCLFFWKLRRERRRIKSTPGALVYRETVIVPSYAITNAENGNDSPHLDNAVQMHAILYDTPPAYDAAVRATTVISEKEKHEAPPPQYASIHF